MKPFLILQARPENEVAESEFTAILAKGGLMPHQVHRLRLERDDVPQGLRLDDYAGVIVGGGPGCVSDLRADKPAAECRIEDAVLSLMDEICDRDFPFMGCCYGIGILCHHLGGDVSKAHFSETVGPVEVVLTDDGAGDALLRGLPARFNALVGHKEAVQALPQGCVHLITSRPCPFQMIRYSKNVYATQFHPEANANDFELRINIYRHKGYFPPDEADMLIARCHEADVVIPAQILRRFVEIYGV